MSNLIERIEAALPKGWPDNALTPQELLLREAAAELATVDRLKEERDAAHASLSSWFDLSKQSADRLTPILMDALRGYLRRNRVGGMDKDLSDNVEAVLEDFCHHHVGPAVLPVLRGLADEVRETDPAPSPAP